MIVQQGLPVLRTFIAYIITVRIITARILDSVGCIWPVLMQLLGQQPWRSAPKSAHNLLATSTVIQLIELNAVLNMQLQFVIAAMQHTVAPRTAAQLL